MKSKENQLILNMFEFDKLSREQSPAVLVVSHLA